MCVLKYYYSVKVGTRHRQIVFSQLLFKLFFLHDIDFYTIFLLSVESLLFCCEAENTNLWYPDEYKKLRLRLVTNNITRCQPNTRKISCIPTHFQFWHKCYERRPLLPLVRLLSHIRKCIWTLINPNTASY